MSRRSTCVALVLAFLLAGCAPLSYENFLMVESGMPRTQVREIMGPWHLREAHDMDYYEDGTHTAEFDYEDDGIVEKNWTGPTNGG